MYALCCDASIALTDPQPPADHAWVLLLLPLLAGLVGHWRLRRDNLQLKRQLAQAEANHLEEVARLQHARDAGVKALCGKLKAARKVHQQTEAQLKHSRNVSIFYFSKTLRAVLKDMPDTTQQT